MKIQDAVLDRDNLWVLKGRTSIVITTRSEAFEVFRKGEVAKLHQYLGKVLNQMEEV